MEPSQIRNMEEVKSWKPFLRQLFICSGVWNCYFIMGLCMGTPTVMVPQLRTANYTISEETASWLPATISFSGIPWVIILSILTNAIGRKRTYIIVNISCLVGYFVLYFSNTINQIYIGQIFQGASVASYITTSVVILTEFTSSEYRGLFLTLKSATFVWGFFIANIVGTFLSWKNIEIVGLLCTVYNLLCVPIWPESPYWLAGKGKFNESSKSHKWLKGSDTKSLKELELLIQSYENKRFIKKNSIRSTFKTLFSQSSGKTFLLSFYLICLYSFSGKPVYSIYAVDILKKITQDNWTAYMGMLILDAVSVASMYLGCILSKMLKRRTMLLGFSSLGLMFIFALSGYLYLAKLSIVTQNTYVSLSLLAAYSVAISCGPMILSSAIIGELFPLESKCVFMCINAFIYKFVFSTFIKISPYCFKHLGMHGTFFLNGIISVVFLVLIYFYLPETNNKSLQEIEASLMSHTSKSLTETNKLIPVVSLKTVKFKE